MLKRKLNQILLALTFQTLSCQYACIFGHGLDLNGTGAANSGIITLKYA